MSFSGTYLDDDVTFLLKQINIKSLNIKDKEINIQSGKKHYSEMISPEYKPSKEYLNIFYKSLDLNIVQFSQDIINLAYKIPKNSIIVSLARAGTPIGVLLKRVIKDRFNINIPHYSVSIIRGKGIDWNAIKYILKKYPEKKILFIDGWTGKGVIGKELKESIQKFNSKFHTNISSKLTVLADISGKASFSVSNKDYMIPSSALNSTISGLVSRTILNRDYIFENDFHGCKFYEEFKPYDLTLWFVDKITLFTKNLNPTINKLLTQDFEHEKVCERYIQDIMKLYDISDINYIKPGVAETTRVLLRRIPNLIILKNLNSNQTKHLVQLAKEKNVTIKEVPNLPYSAVGIIRDINKEK